MDNLQHNIHRMTEPLSRTLWHPLTSFWVSISLILSSSTSVGARGGAVGWGTALQSGRSRVRFSMVSLEFFIDIILPAALWPWGRLSLQQKWVPGIFPGGKDGRCVGLTTFPLSCADCLENWEPQPPGTLWACNGIALPLPISTSVYQ